MYDLIIIGSGPAGLGAAIYGKRAGYSTLVLEKNPMSGGQVLNTCEVDNYLGLPGINGFDLGMQFREHADRLGTEFVEADVTGIKNLPDCKKVLTSAGEFTAKAVIIAAGGEHKKLGVPGEKRLAGRGISYCATCDGAFYKKKVTAVIGGGDVAVEDAIFLAGLCEKVYLIHRRDSLRAAKSLQEKLFTLPNVELVWNAAVEEITGEAFVTGVQLLDTQTKEERFVAADGIFIAVGISIQQMNRTKYFLPELLVFRRGSQEYVVHYLEGAMRLFCRIRAMSDSLYRILLPNDVLGMIPSER